MGENYGHVIVDQCHHVGAVSLDQLLQSVKAKYVLGLTATRAASAPHDLEGTAWHKTDSQIPVLSAATAQMLGTAKAQSRHRLGTPRVLSCPTPS